MQDRLQQLAEIDEQIRQLTESPLYPYRIENNYLAVLGEGNPTAQIMFIGEAPGEREAQTGRPFVGASGRVLDELLASIDLKREDVYITNVVKDRPPDNRNPTAEEIRLYTPFLIRQIEIIQPAVIATLGKFAMEFIVEQLHVDIDAPKISQIHGQVLTGRTDYNDEIAVVPLYHPAVALYSNDQKSTLLEDFQVLKSFLI